MIDLGIFRNETFWRKCRVLLIDMGFRYHTITSGSVNVTKVTGLLQAHAVTRKSSGTNADA
jgi:hypothetical protein